MTRRLRWTALAAGGLLVVLLGAAFMIEGMQHRLVLVGRKAAGGLPDVPWGDLVFMLGPSSPVWLVPLADNPNPYVSITRPDTTGDDVRRGEELFLSGCAGCHATDARGGSGPALIGRILTHGDTDWALYRTIRAGVPGTGMAAQPLSRSETWQVISHLRTLSAAPGKPDGKSEPIADRVRVDYPSVSFERLKQADRTAGEDGWLMYSGSYNGQRYTPLAQIDRTNVAKLSVSWIRPIAGIDEVVQSTPLVNGDIMFVTAPPQRVIAVSTRTGAVLWEYSRSLPTTIAGGYGMLNRGVALFQDQVFVGTLDAHLVALDAETGRVRWDVEVAPYRESYSITSAPLAIDGLIITGISGGDYPTRGFIDAYDAATGRRQWRFHTIPSPGEPGSETWPIRAAAIGGAATWLTGSFDSVSNRVIWGVGNPTPSYNGDVRPGDNLYSSSAVALDGATGRLAWHFQFTPHDEYDWDSAQVPVLADLSPWGGLSKAILWANRNGFFYTLDGTTGAFRRGTPFVRQNWAHGLDPAGRPIRVAGSSPSEQGTLIYPPQQGATTWWPPTFSPKTGLFYVSASDGSTFYFRSSAPPEVGRQYLGGVVRNNTNPPPIASVKAISPVSGEIVWENRTTPDASRLAWGLMSTGGGLVFVCRGTRLLALDASTGTMLWQFDTSQRINTAPMSFVVDGRQHIAVAAGALLLTFRLPVE